MYILGISCFYHDSAACIVKDGNILAAVQEERFTRKKLWWGFDCFVILMCSITLACSCAIRWWSHHGSAEKRLTGKCITALVIVLAIAKDFNH